MEIYKANKLQKLYFKHTNVNFKGMRTIILNENLYYLVFHQITNRRDVEITKNVVQRFKENINNDTMTTVEYVDERISLNVPKGMYFVEYIKVD